MTGINVIMFYSNIIFDKGTDLSNETITAMVGLVFFISASSGMLLLTKFGRRTIMLFCLFSMSIVLFMLGISGISGHSTLMVVFTMIFIVLFGFGPGPVTWLYMAEIMQDKAFSIGALINWLGCLIVSAVIPGIIERIGHDNIGWIFIVLGILTFMSFIYAQLFMLETRGKSQI